jgi:hypothetical protein
VIRRSRNSESMDTHPKAMLIIVTACWSTFSRPSLSRPDGPGRDNDVVSSCYRVSKLRPRINDLANSRCGARRRMWAAKVQTIVNRDLQLIGADRHSKLLIHLRLEGATPRRLFTV